LAYLTSASLTMKQPIAPIIARMPARLSCSLVLIRIDVPSLRDAAFVHHFRGREILGPLVPPDGAALRLLALELRLSFLHLANESRVLGFVVAGGKHRHGGGWYGGKDD